MKNMQSFVRPHEKHFSYMNNPQIMRIVNDSYGNLNQKFNGNQISTGNLPGFSPNNCHYMLSGNKFVPMPMEISMREPHFEHRLNTGFSSNDIKSLSTMHAFQPKVQKTTTLMPQPVPRQQRNESSFPSNSMKPTPLSSVKVELSQLPRISQGFDDKQNKKENYQVKTIFCTGTIERLLRWNRNLEGVFCIYETIAPIVALQEGGVKNQKIMLLRDKKGPILQVQYYTSTHIDITDFCIGQYLRCVGRMIGFNILSAESIREAKENEISTLARLSYVCDYSVTHNLNKD